MQAVLVIQIYDVESQYTVHSIAEVIYELRKVSIRYLDTYSLFQHIVVGILPTVQQAIDIAGRIMRSVPVQVCVSIGYGYLTQMQDESYIGYEMSHALTLVQSSNPGEISLSTSAQEQVPRIEPEYC